MSQQITVLVPEALDANRAGRLTDDQRKTYRGMSRGTRKSEVQIAGLAVVLGLLVWLAPGPARYATVKPLIGIACLIIAGALVVRAFLGADAMTRDMRSGRVESTEGAVTKWTTTTDGHGAQGTSVTTYHAQVGEIKVETGPHFYQSIPDAGFVRMYYLPISRRLVNLEPSDHALPAGALTDPNVMLHDAKEGIAGAVGGGFFGNPAKGAEARAEVAAIGNAMKGQFSADGSPPPASERDPRPLAQAILGSWRNPMMTLVFSADGTATMAAALGGMRQAGHWSVDANGRLVADIAGATQGVDAWIVGDRLTVVMGGQSTSLQRTE